ncbi:MAG: hypothetical protein JO271_16195 [Verrucomicrobia bacterium]|nr:hypothetical protein [Verrucomicrobiota bacterium]
MHQRLHYAGLRNPVRLADVMGLWGVILGPKRHHYQILRLAAPRAAKPEQRSADLHRHTLFRILHLAPSSGSAKRRHRANPISVVFCILRYPNILG